MTTPSPVPGIPPMPGTDLPTNPAPDLPPPSSDPIPDPEPASPSLSGPDLGVFGHTISH